MHLSPKPLELISKALRKKITSFWVGSVYLEAFSCSDFQKQSMDQKHQEEKMEINAGKCDMY